MDKKAKTLVASLVILAVLTAILIPLSFAGKPYCGDGRCNGGETVETCPSDCSSGNETLPKLECSDGIDNDRDGLTDYSPKAGKGDSGCDSRNDNDETNCGDSVCEGGETCSSCAADCGICACSDSDGGLNLPLIGTCLDSYGGHTDNCATSTTLNEYYCTGQNECTYTTYNCAYNSTTCLNGACI